MKFTELKTKEVIDCKDGRRLGFVVDLSFDPRDGCIKEIIVPTYRNGFDCFRKPKVFCIPYRDIIKIGPDLILVRICEKK